MSKRQQCKILRMKYRFLIKRIFYTHKIVSKVEKRYGHKFHKLLKLKKLVKKFKKHHKKPTYVLPSKTTTSTSSTTTSTSSTTGTVANQVVQKSGSTKLVYSFVALIISLIMLF